MPLKFSKQHLEHALPKPPKVTVFQRTISLLDKLRYLAVSMAFYVLVHQCHHSRGLQGTAMRSSKAAAHLRTYRMTSYSILAWLVGGVVLHVFWMAWSFLPRFWESRRHRWMDFRNKMSRALKNLEFKEENEHSIQEEERVILNNYEKKMRKERFLEFCSNAILLSAGFAVCVVFNQVWKHIRSDMDVTVDENSSIPMELFTLSVYYLPGLLSPILTIFSCISFVLLLKDNLMN